MIKDNFSGSPGDKNKRSKLARGETGPLYELEAQDLIEFAKVWASLDDATAEKLDELIDDPENAELALRTVDLLERRLGGFNEEIDDAIATWRETNERDEDDDNFGR